MAAVTTVDDGIPSIVVFWIERPSLPGVHLRQVCLREAPAQRDGFRVETIGRNRGSDPPRTLPADQTR